MIGGILKNDAQDFCPWCYSHEDSADVIKATNQVTLRYWNYLGGPNLVT